MELIIASANVHKKREFRDMLQGVGQLDLFSLADFPDYKPPEENGSTFQENATIKALHAAKALNKWVLADDSGLVVPILGAAPGVYSKRYAGPGASDAENRKKLLQELANKNSEEERTAFFECCLGLANPDGMVKCVEARCEGRIAFEERGRNGFGYDSLFIKHDYDKTFAELDPSVKNRISHRRKAFDRMIPFIIENILK